MGLPAGLVLGPYEVICPIGAGGMGEVYEARDTRLERLVAVKVLPAELELDASRLVRFELEAKAAAALNHPNIAVVYDVGSAPAPEGDRTVHYMVQERLEGESLRELLGRGRPRLARALAIAAEIASGLAAAHEAGIVHRDLKPANVFVSGDGHVKILDFGLAKLRTTSPSGGSEDSTSLMLTSAGAVLGTAGYMAPEQIESPTDVDHRADLFSLGCVLYELLTGARAFEGDNVHDTLTRILRDEPPGVHRRVPALPSRLDWIVRKCLAKDVTERYQGAADLVVDLKSVAAAPPPPTGERSEPAASWKKWIWLAASVPIALVAGYLLGRSESVETDPPVRRFTIRTRAAQVHATRSGKLLGLSPDGGRLAYVDGNRLWIRDLAELEPRLVEDRSFAVSPFFSPNGEWLAYADQISLRKIWLHGGASFSVCPQPAVGGGSWSEPDTLVFSDGTSLWLVSAEGGDCRRLTDPNGSVYLYPEWLPGGREILAEERQEGADPRVVVLSAETGGVEEILVEPAGDPRFVAPDLLLVSRGETVLGLRFDPATLTTRGDPTPVLTEVTHQGPSQFAISAGGTLAYVPAQEPQLELVWVDRSGRQEVISERRESYWAPRLAPDGRHIAVVSAGGDGRGLLVHDIERGSQEVFDPAGFWPAWSPDGRRLTFVRSDVGATRLVDRPFGGSAEATPLLDDPGGLLRVVLSYSTNPEILIYNIIHPTRSRDIWILPTEPGAEPVEILATDAHEFAPRLSPDARWLAFSSDRSGRDEVYVMGCRPCRPDLDLPEPPIRVSVDGGTAPVWRSDGGELFYLESSRMMSVDVESESALSVSEPRVLFEGDFVPDQFGNQNYDVTADGERFVMIRTPDAEESRFRIHVVLNWSRELRSRLGR